MKLLWITLLMLLNIYTVFSQFRDRVYYLKSFYTDIDCNYQSYKFGETNLNEMSFPVQIAIPFSENISLSVANTPVMVMRDINGIKRTINTITDTRAGLKFIFFNKHALLNFYGNIPTGKRKLDLEAFDIETQLGLNLLKYKMPLFGQGFNAGGALVFVLPLSQSNTLGVGAALNYREKFEPINLNEIKVDSILEYDPGDDIGFNLSYVFYPGQNFKFSINALYSIFMKDKINNIEVFHTGNRICIAAQLSLMTGNFQHIFIFQDRIRSGNKQFVDNSWLYIKNGQQMEGSYNLSIPISMIFSLLAHGELRFYDAGQDNWNGTIINTGKSMIYGGGLGIKTQMTYNIGIELSGKYLNGKLKLKQDYDLTGLDFYARLNFTF